MRPHSAIIASIIAVLLPSLSRASAGEGEAKKKRFDVFSDDNLPEGDASEEESARPAAGGGALAIVIPRSAKDASLAGRVGRVLTERLAKHFDVEPIDLETAIAPEAKAERKKDIAAAFAEVEKGTKAFEDLDLETAGSVLETSTNTLLSYLDDLDPEERRTLERSIFTYGATTLFEGETELATSIFVALLLLSPKYAPATDQVPSNVLARFEQLRGHVEERPTGGVKVNTVPEGADVYIDGSFKGASPVEVAGLADGQHVIVARRLGFKPFGTLAPVTADQKASVDIDLEAAEGRDAIDALSPDLAGDLRGVLALGKKISAQKIAVLRIDAKPSGTHIDGILCDTERDALVGRIRDLTVVPDPDVASESIARALLGGEDALVAVETHKKDEAPITEQWWFWAILGAAVAAAGITVWAVAESGGERHPPPNGIVLGF
jgi:hypothetical protein